MTRTATVRKYGRSTRKQTAEVLFAQLPRTPVKADPEPEPEPEPAREPGLDVGDLPVDEVSQIAEKLEATRLEDTSTRDEETESHIPDQVPSLDKSAEIKTEAAQDEPPREADPDDHHKQEELEPEEHEAPAYDDLRVLTWADLCPAGDRIEKIAEASYAEVYRITNAHGTSIIKVVRLQSPIKPQTKAQERSGLVDEEPHAEEDMQGELRISEWLADIPGFVVYKEQYVVQGKAPKALLETHQAFHRRMKRKDPDRLQFYPSPSRYLDDTRFLVVELGDAGTALEDFELTSISQVWDIFLLTALALARAEDLVEFEHRDLHEGNLCIRQVRPPTPKPSDSNTSAIQFGFSGLDITILDYGLSRATDPDSDQPPATVVAYDLEKDLPLFQSTHAPQCTVYRQMRSFLIHADRIHPLPAKDHTTPYLISRATGEPISWKGYHPYTNVLWLAYLYAYLIGHFKGGDKRELKRFRRETAELRAHLDPAAPRGVLSFPSAGEVVRFAVEAGWVGEGQVVDLGGEGTSEEDKEEG
ncbi:hypothetical protein C8A01DRAFT_50671 [Parachaetomium inaequale]|uniref:non-specific serine/threonine protein kinase n=1 Tax=Parachaetomium inaequale TaxID=2588326 RepID=A0AAN6P6J7_9PEZI|nr:hypothetical protein C8A01DRAFT_50671 [Parachaetomium inaequale]